LLSLGTFIRVLARVRVLILRPCVIGSFCEVCSRKTFPLVGLVAGVGRLKTVLLACEGRLLARELKRLRVELLLKGGLLRRVCYDFRLTALLQIFKLLFGLAGFKHERRLVLRSLLLPLLWTTRPDRLLLQGGAGSRHWNLSLVTERVTVGLSVLHLRRGSLQSMIRQSRHFLLFRRRMAHHHGRVE